MSGDISSLIFLGNKAIIQTAEKYNSNTGFYDDLVGLGRRAFPEKSQTEQIDTIATFMLAYTQMWHDLGNQDPERQRKNFRYPLFMPEHITPDENLDEYVSARVEGLHPLFADAEHIYVNSKLNPLDFLYMLKNYMREWAWGMRTGSPEGDWCKMQDGLAEDIRFHLHFSDRRSFVDVFIDRIKWN